MATKVHLIMPMGGRGSRFSNEGFDFPKPLIQIYNNPFFYWATKSISKFIDLASLDFVVLQEHVDKYSIDKEIIRYFPEARLHILPEVTKGAVVTCLKGIEDIEDDLPIMFNDCDHLFKSNSLNAYFSEGIKKDIEGILLTFNSNEDKYSYVEKDINGNVIRTIEKEVISDEAICGCYYFSNTNVFKNAAEKYLKKCNYTEYFMSGVYNIMIEEGQCVRTMLTDFHVPFGVPDEYEVAKEDDCYKELM